ncbi:MAG: hypothetical protein AAB874_00915, partial [Patescibacteria group bacterium]
IGIHTITAFYQPLAIDEIASLFFSQTYTYGELLLKGGPEVIHPPLYYVLVKILYSLFQSVVILRGFQVFLFIFMLYLLFRIGTEIALTKPQIYFLLTSWSLSPYILRITYWLRMYTLAITLQLIVIYLTLQYLKQSQMKLLLWILIVEFLAFFTVYGSVLFIASQTVIAFYVYFNQRKYLMFFLSHAVMLFSSLMSILIILMMSSDELTHHLNWVEHPNFGNISRTLLNLGGFGDYTTQGFNTLTQNPILYGSLFVVLVVLLIVAFRCMKTQVFHKTLQIKYLLAQTGILFLTFLAVSAFSAVYPTSLFHERQLFSFAVSLHIGIPIIIFIVNQRYPTIGAISMAALTILYTMQLIPLIPPKIIYPDNIIRLDINSAPNPKYGIYPDLVLSYHQCKAVSFNDIVSKCKTQGITMVKDLSEVASYIGKEQPFSLLISDAYRGIFGEKYLARFCKPHPSVSTLWNCIAA